MSDKTARKLSPTQQRVVDSMRDGKPLWMSTVTGRAYCDDLFVHWHTMKALRRRSVVELDSGSHRYGYDYRLTESWR